MPAGQAAVVVTDPPEPKGPATVVGATCEVMEVLEQTAKAEVVVPGPTSMPSSAVAVQELVDDPAVSWLPEASLG